jgi:outer membrane protein TolC
MLKAGFYRRFILLCFRQAGLLSFMVCLLFVFGSAGGCQSPKQQAKEADKAAYNIIDKKWQSGFGEKGDYQIRDSVATTEEILAGIPPSGVLTLAKAVEIATKYSRDYQSQKESLYASALNLTSTRHQYEIQWFGTFDGQYRTQVEGDGSGSTETKTLSSELGVKQAFVTAGGIATNIGLTLDWERFLTKDPYSTISSVLTASITAPLLGNGAGKTAWENLTQAERNMLYSIRSFNRYRQTFVVSTISNYYTVLQQKKTLEINRASYNRQVLSNKQLKMEVEVGRRAQSDAAEAEQQLLSAKNNLVSAEQSYAQAIDSYKVTLSLPTDVNITLDPNELAVLEKIGVGEPEYSIEDAIKMALELRLDLANTRDRLDDSERKVILAAQGLGVQVNLTGSANVPSSDDNQYTRLRFHEGTYALGFETDLGLDPLSKRNTYRQALISVQQSQRGYDQDIENVKLAVHQAYRNMVETAESYRIQQLSLKLAENRVKEQKLLLEYSQGTVRLLLESEDALVSAQNNATQALVRHLTAKLAFFRDIGILSVRPDGMWEQKKL